MTSLKISSARRADLFALICHTWFAHVNLTLACSRIDEQFRRFAQ